MQTGMEIIFMSASMRDIPAKPVQGQPLFAYTAVGSFNFRLSPGSPLIGKGNTTIVPLTVVPLDPIYGATAVTLPGADLGCYQFNGTGNQH